jgi:uncharacterized iron-regulated protein
MIIAVSGPPVFTHPHPESLETDLMPYPFWTEPQPDDIYHVPTGLKLSFEGMMGMVSAGRVVYVGEAHSNVHSHRIQLEIIRELERRSPGKVAIGMEMFREPQQESLDRWTKGDLSEHEFLRESRWYDNWNSSFGYYRDILHFARDKGIDVVALNPPKELQQLVGMGHPLPEEMETQLPEIDSSDPYQRAMVEAVYGAHEGAEKMQETFLRVQLLWEENMAEQIAGYLASSRGEGKIMVVIAGGAHVQHGYGVPKRVLRRLPAPYYIVLPAVISAPAPEDVPEGERIYMDVDLPEIPLLSADFIWAVPYEFIGKRKVLMGIRLNFDEGTGTIEQVAEDSPAMEAGVRVGDVLVGLDDVEIRDMEDVTIVMRSKTVGDSIDIRVLRDGSETTFRARFTEPASSSG